MADFRTLTAQSPESIAEEVGRRLGQLRLSRNIKQSELARDSGVSERTLRRLESGKGATLDSFIRILIALKLQRNMSLLVPDPRIRPFERVRTGGNERQRARPAKTPKPGKEWRWENGQ